MFKTVTLQPREYVFPTTSPAPLLDSEKFERVSARLSLHEAMTVTLMVEAQLRYYNIWWAKPYGRYRRQVEAYHAAEVRVVSDIVGLELDLWEIGAQFEEAKCEAQYG